MGAWLAELDAIEQAKSRPASSLPIEEAAPVSSLAFERLHRDLLAVRGELLTLVEAARTEGQQANAELCAAIEQGVGRAIAAAFKRANDRVDRLEQSIGELSAKVDALAGPKSLRAVGA